MDGNVYRVLARIFGIDTPIDSNAGKKVFSGLAAELRDRQHPDLYNQAIMDFGSIQCTPKVPVCLYCPLRENCVALASGQVEKLPVKAGKAVVKPRYFNYLHIHCRGVNLLARREAKDIWQNLYEYPLIETGQETELEVLQQTPAYLELMQEAGEIQIPVSYTHLVLLACEDVHLHKPSRIGRSGPLGREFPLCFWRFPGRAGRRYFGVARRWLQ